MNNQNIGRISIRTSRRKRVPHSFSHDVNASMRVGEILPSVIREIIPNTKSKIQSRNIIRLAPLVAPSYANLSLKHKMYFVGMSDLSRNFTAFMAKQPVTRSGKIFTPNQMPYLPLSFLSALCLIGARGTLYALRASDVADSAAGSRFNLGEWTSDLEDHSSLLNVTAFSHFFDGGNGLAGVSGEGGFDAAVDDNLFYKKVMPTFWQSFWNGYNGPAINLGRISKVFTSSQVSFDFWIPFGNTRGLDFWSDTNAERDYSDGYTVVPIDKADAVYRLDYDGAPDGDVYYLAVRFSSCGERLYNLLLSSGSGFNPVSREPITLMPYFATWKAYFESFGLLQYRNYETSAQAGILDYFDETGDSDVFAKLVSAAQVGTDTYLSRFVEWLIDLCTMFWTSETDFTSAHTRKPVIASAEWNVNGLLAGPNPPNGPENEFSLSGVNQSEPDSVNPTEGGARMVGQFTQLDLEKMQRLYKVINRETIAGRKIADILRANGLGDYVDSVVSRYIGEDAVPIDIDEIDATNDAFDGNGDISTLLGEQGAKGSGFGVTRKHSFTSNEYGYYIVLSSIVPEVGFSQQGKAQAHNLKPLDFYNPEYDGLGFEENSKALAVTAVENFADPSTPSLNEQGFGFVPMYSRHKFMPNLCLGAFALETERADADPRYLDRRLDVGVRYVSKVTQHTDYKALDVVKAFPSVNIPVASPTYRFIGRYPWLENYVRIFANQGTPQGGLYHFPAEALGNIDRYLYSDRQPVQFFVHMRFVWPLYAPMLAFEDSFETKEDGTNGPSDLSIGKA